MPTLLAVALAAGCASGGSGTPPSGTPPSGAPPSPAPTTPSPPGLPRGDLLSQEVPDLEIRALLLLLADRRLFEPVTVDQALKGPPELRAELARSLGRAGDPSGRVDLFELLDEPSPPVRRVAAFALGELGESEAARGVETVPAAARAAANALRLAASDADRETGRLAVEALGKLGAPLAEVRAALAGLPAAEGDARLLPHLFRFDPDERLPVAERGLAVADPELRAMAAYAVARDAVPAGRPLLRRLLADEDEWVRSWAARGLGQVGDGGDLARLLPLLSDPRPGPIVQALRAAQTLIAGGAAAAAADWTPRLSELLADPRPHVRVEAIATAAAWPGVGELESALAGKARGDGGEEVWERAAALDASARSASPRAGDLIAAAASSALAELRTAAARAAGELTPGGRSAGGPPAEGVHPALERLLEDPQPAVRAAALGAVVEVLGAAAAETVLAALERDTDPGVRTIALAWTAEHPGIPLALLGQAAAWALADRNVESSLEAVRALAAHAEAVPAERDACIALLDQLARVREYAVRREAAVALGRLGLPVPALGAVETALELDDYRGVVLRTWQPRTVELTTTAGPLTLRLACPQAPMTCLNFLNLARQGFYDGLAFHRVVPDFVVQGGDPRGDGFGGPGYTVRDEINRLRYERGVVGMALAGPDTGGSQFFVTLSPQPHLDGGYTVFGHVVDGEETLERIVPGTRIESVRF